MREARSQCALGLQVVDEAVFALRKAAWLCQSFFYLEQEVMKPAMRFIPSECRRCRTRRRVEGRAAGRAARALFSATEIVSANKLKRNSRTVRRQGMRSMQALSSAFLAQVGRFRKVSAGLRRDSGQNDMARIIAKLTADSAPNFAMCGYELAHRTRQQYSKQSPTQCAARTR